MNHYAHTTGAKFRRLFTVPIFSGHRRDIALPLMAAILTFKCTEGAGVENYSSMGGGGANSRLLPNRLRPYKVFLTLMQDGLAARNAKRSISTILQKNRGL